MYEKIVGYFERNLCIENINFRKKQKVWIIGLPILLLVELSFNYIIVNLVENIWIRVITIIGISCVITFLYLVFSYALPVIKMYKEKVKADTILDIPGLLMKEERLSAYMQIEIEEMDNFLRKECKIKNPDSINLIIKIIDDELENKYAKRSFSDYTFNSTILPLLILILTVYFTNNNEQQLANIVIITFISAIALGIAGKWVFSMKNFNIANIRKRENLQELKRVLADIQIEWSKKRK